ncbi:MAG: hypothetical protein V9F01_00005, partial [Chitinophagaceae bacterium]
KKTKIPPRSGLAFGSCVAAVGSWLWSVVPSSLLSRLLGFGSVFRYGWLLGWRGMGLAIRQSYPQGDGLMFLMFYMFLCSPRKNGDFFLKIK